MTKVKTLKLIFGNGDLIQCPSMLIEKSDLLLNIQNIQDQSSEPLLIPNFVTKGILLDIIQSLEYGNIDNFMNSTIEYIIHVQMALDFFAIYDLSTLMLPLIDARVSIDNSFQVFKLTNKIPCFHSITIKSISLMMIQIEEYYKKNELFENMEDPFVDMYSLMTTFEIEIMISSLDQYFTVSKIMILKNWINKNPGSMDRNKIINILYNINIQASYIPRREISFMRKIRNIILQEL